MWIRDNISFEPLRERDLQQVFAWLRNPCVARWYGPLPDSIAEVQAKYRPRIRGEEPVHCAIVHYQKKPVAFIQCYLVSYDAPYAQALNVDPGAVAVDLFIGDDDYRSQGFGPIMIQEFVRRVVFQIPGCTCCIISPAIDNKRAVSAYEKAGFRYLKTVPVPGEEQPEYVTILLPHELEERIKELDERNKS
jgi:aminoglycoside 6'-N-acetyltransferase